MSVNYEQKKGNQMKPNPEYRDSTPEGVEIFYCEGQWRWKQLKTESYPLGVMRYRVGKDGRLHRLTCGRND